GERGSIFHFTMHHIISDGWSMELLRNEVLHNYVEYQSGVEPENAPLRIQYKDYASWQQQQLSSAAFAEHREYWLDQLSGELPVLSLPSFRRRPLIQTYRGYELSTVIGRGTADRLRSVCQAGGSTLFMGLLGVLNTLFYRYTGLEDMIVGSPVAGREHADLEDQIGFYVNMLPLRTRLSGKDSYREVLSKVRAVTMAGYAHQMYPFDRLVEELGLHRDISRSPVFDVLMVLHNQFSREGSSGDSILDTNVNYVGECDVKLDLLISFTEIKEGLHMGIQYNSDVYDEASMLRLLEHYKALLEAVTEHPDVSICD